MSARLLLNSAGAFRPFFLRAYFLDIAYGLCYDNNRRVHGSISVPAAVRRIFAAPHMPAAHRSPSVRLCDGRGQENLATPAFVEAAEPVRFVPGRQRHAKRRVLHGRKRKAQLAAFVSASSVQNI